MNKILLMSIKPIFAEKIYNREKIIEFRKSNPAVMPGDTMFIYETSPVKAITGCCLIDKIKQSYSPKSDSLSKEFLERQWDGAKDRAGITKKEYMKYYDGAKKAVFIYIENPDKYIIPTHLDELRNTIPGFIVPQNYRYLDEEETEIISDLTAGINYA